jgi:hypothetical protein
MYHLKQCGSQRRTLCRSAVASQLHLVEVVLEWNYHIPAIFAIRISTHHHVSECATAPNMQLSTRTSACNVVSRLVFSITFEHISTKAALFM